MATRFEMVLHGHDQVALRAAADEAFQEIERLHAQLSLYSPSSEISFINAHAAQRPVQVEPRLFALLQLAQRIHQETRGSFDITVAPLLHCWGFLGGSGSMPTPEQIEEARAKVGMQHVTLDDTKRTIRFARTGMMIDLGSIGKGYALEVATELLLEAGVESALIHGGTSTICAIGTPPAGGTWKVAIPWPPAVRSQANVEGEIDADRPLAVVTLENESLSVSGVHGKCFTARGQTFGHVLDPRTGSPAQGAALAAVAQASAAETDALSTALLIEGLHGHVTLAGLRTRMRTLVLGQDATTGRLVFETNGIESLEWARKAV
jgi:thiamine biosynthesis lipoprotein